MKLIGMLDSPYVRRVAVSFHLQGIDFSHLPISVFSAYDEFAALNPVVKAPTLITDEGVTLLDSGLILEFAEGLTLAELSLRPTEPLEFLRAQRIIGLALAACEKSVQIVYEHNLRPKEKMHRPWIDRVQDQLLQAYRLLESEVAEADPWIFGDRPMQADVSAAVAYRFSCELLPPLLPDLKLADLYPALAALSARAEATEAFQLAAFS
jgi:glutathione S-transferase